MATIITRSGKGLPLTNTEVDNNFTNLNTDKVEKSGDSMTGNLSFGDNDKAIFGADSDLQIYHTGSHSWVQDAGTGNLYVAGDHLWLTNSDNTKQFLKGDSGGTTSLYYNTGVKLATTSTGIDVTGNTKTSGKYLAGSGGASAPDYTFTSDATMGMFRSPGNLCFATGSTERMRIDSAGTVNTLSGLRVGGTTDDSAQGNIGCELIRFRNASTTSGQRFQLDAEGATASQQLVTYWYDGTGYRSRLSIAGTTTETVLNDVGYDIDFRVESDTATHALYVDGASGTVCVNTANPAPGSGGIQITPRNSVAMGTNNGSAYYAGAFYYNSSLTGSIYLTSSGTTYNTTSDRRLKDNIETITDGTDKLMAMNPVTHTWKADPDAPAVHGFIAQEMQDVIPEAVSGEDGGDEMMSMDYGRITPVIVAALQDAHREIQNLKAEIAALKGDK